MQTGLPNTANLYTFLEEDLNGKLRFCAVFGRRNDFRDLWEDPYKCLEHICIGKDYWKFPQPQRFFFK